MTSINFHSLPLCRGVVIIAVGIALAGCGPASPTGSATGGNMTGGSGAAPAAPVLPVADNPIANHSTVQSLAIDSLLVENNVDPTSGKAAADHLEIALRNSGSTALSTFEVFYSFSDPTAKVVENYYAKLPDSFTIPAGGTSVVHFDDTGAPGHFPVNKYSLYYTSKNALDVSVTVSATGAAVQTATLTKDPGGAENPGE